MLTRTIDWSLRHRWIVLVATAAVVAAGVLAFRDLPIDAFPDTTPTQVQVNAVAAALTPEEVEQQLTIPIEHALSGLPHVEELRSISKSGLAQVTLRFADGTDLWFARQQVAERIGRVEVPSGVGRPSLGPVATGLGEVFHYLVKSKTRSLEDLRTLHDWVIAPQLRSVPGVAEVNTWGGKEKQWHVVVDPRRLQQFDLSMGDLYRALEANNANVGGGVVERGGPSRTWSWPHAAASRSGCATWRRCRSATRSAGARRRRTARARRSWASASCWSARTATPSPPPSRSGSTR
jgi:cobalt-zinc-cadmium resistance protein CzcA